MLIKLTFKSENNQIVTIKRPSLKIEVY